MEGKIVGKPNRYYAQLVNMPDFVKGRYAYNILKYRRLEVFIIEPHRDEYCDVYETDGNLVTNNYVPISCFKIIINCMY